MADLTSTDTTAPSDTAGALRRGEGDPDRRADGSPEVAAAAGGGWPSRAWRRVVRRPHGWFTRPWTDDRIIKLAVTLSTLVVTTFIMMRIVHFNPLAWMGIGETDLIFDDTTPTGGDMGAHVWGPAYLRDELLPNWQLTGWSMDWYAGLPAYRFYMVVPALAIVALDTVFAYGVAFKLVAISGLVSLPFCCWVFGRLARFRYPLPELFAVAALCFLLNESYDIFGGNVLSTMAGEFSFSIAVSLMMLGLGFLCRALDTGRYAVWAAVFLALACLSHGIVLIYAAVGALIIIACRSGADLWKVLCLVVGDPTARQRRTMVYALLLSPAAIALTVLLAQVASEFYVLTGLAALGAVALAAVVSAQAGWGLTANRVFVTRLALGCGIGLLTMLLSAFWVGPFLLNHDFMTDMKYAPYPESAGSSYWRMLFDQKPLIDFAVNTLAIVGLIGAIVRRHVYGIALGVTMVVAAAMVYLTHGSLPIINLLWNPRVLPWLYLMRYLMMMVGAVELAGWVVNLVRNRPGRTQLGTGAASVTAALAGLVVLLIFGWVYQVLPFAGYVTQADGTREYAWGPLRAETTLNSWDRARGWTSYNFKGYEGLAMYPEYHDVVETMDQIGDDRGCGRALWERLTGGDDRGYGTPMALMLLPHWTNGCITSSEGLFFEASGTTPYHFIAADAMSCCAYNPVRQVREIVNDASVGVPYLQALGIRYLMVASGPAVAEAEVQPELTLLDTIGPWHIYEVADADVVVPLDVQPVVVNEREGDARECWLEVGTSWFQQRSEWAALPAAAGPADWQRIDVVADPARQEPQGQPTDRCGEPQSSPNRRVNIVQPASAIDVVELDAVEVSNVDVQQQSLSFDVSEPGVPILVRVSYFPNWDVDGAEGPYRVAPNMMLVVPTDTHVSLSYGRSTSDTIFYVLTLLGIVVAIGVRVRGPLRIPPTEAVPAR